MRRLAIGLAALLIATPPLQAQPAPQGERPAEARKAPEPRPTQGLSLIHI